jgi:hypothetical protein
MAEPPKDPMQAVAYARVLAAELASDALEQASTCRLAAATQKTAVDSIAGLANVIGGEVGQVLGLLVTALRGAGEGLEQAHVRFQAHAEAWEREEKVWQSLMEPAAAPSAEKP